MLRGSIAIRTTKVYGNPAIYPACASAQMLANIAGTKTITERTINALLDANVQVQMVYANGDYLTINSTDDIIYP